MTKEFYHDIDINANQLFNSRLHNISTAARIILGSSLGIGDKGYQVYDTDLLNPYFWDGVQWNTSGSSGIWGSITGIIIAQTDLINYLSTNYYPLSTNPAGYLTSETDPVWTADKPSYLTSAIAALTYEPIITAGTTNQYWRGDKTWQTFPTIPTITPSALTRVNDTNVTLTLGGSPSTALLASTSLTLGWTGTLADSRIASASTWNGKQNALLGTGIVKSTGGTISYLTDNTANWDTAYNSRISTFTTTGSSGSATFNSTTLNIPTYTLSGLGGEPAITAGTTSQYWRGDKTWQTFPTIPTVGTWGALNYPTWVSGTPFVKMTAAGTFALDTNSYFVLPSFTAGSVLFSNGTTIAQDNANFFWDDTNNRLGIGTATPAYNLDVNGTGRFVNALYADTNLYVNNYFQIDTTSTAIPSGYVGIWRRKGNGYVSFFMEDEQGAAKDKWAFVKRQGYNGLRDWYQTNSSIVNINYGWGDPNSSNYQGATLLIDPTINITNPLFTGTVVRGVYYNPTLTSIVNTTHIGFENTTGGNYLNSTSGSTSIGFTSGTATSYKLTVNGNQNISGKLNFTHPNNATQIRIGANGDNVGGAHTGGDSVIIGSVAGNALLAGGGTSLVAVGRNAGGTYTSGGTSSVHIGRNSGVGITTGSFNTHMGMTDALDIPSNTSYTLHLLAGGGYEFNNATATLSGLTTKYAMIGGGYQSATYINDFYFGAGPFVTVPSSANLALYAPSGNGTDLVGSNFTLNAGRGTGTGTPGDIILRTSTPLTTGTTVQTLTERLRVSGTTGNVTASSLAGSGTRMVVASSTGVLSTQALANSSYAQYFSYVNQTAVTNDVGVAMYFELPDPTIVNGVTVISDGGATSPNNLTKITFANAGKYNLQFSTQFQNADNAQHDIYIWLRKNGTTSAADVVGSTGLVSVPARRAAGVGNEGHVITGWNFLLDVNAGDYYQIVWATSNVANIQIQFYASTANHPSTASTLFTVTPVVAGLGSGGSSGALYKFASNTYQSVSGTSTFVSAGISGASFTSGDLLKIDTVVATTTTSLAAVGISYWINTSATITGAVQIANYNAAITNIYIPMNRVYWANGGNFYARNFTGSTANSQNAANSALSTTAIPSTFYIIVQIVTTGTDLAGLSSFVITKT